MNEDYHPSMNRAYLHEVKIAVYLASHGIIINYAINDNLIASYVISTSSVVVFRFINSSIKVMSIQAEGVPNVLILL